MSYAEALSLIKKLYHSPLSVADRTVIAQIRIKMEEASVIDWMLGESLREIVKKHGGNK